MQKISAHIVVIGAGIIGAVSAWRLARLGMDVALVDAKEPGGQATRAAAGILSPTAESLAPDAFWQLLRTSFDQFPHMVELVEKDSGMLVELATTGVIQAALSSDQQKRLQERFDWQREMSGVQWLDADALAEIEPIFSAKNFGGIYASHEKQVHAQQLMAAVVKAGLAQGVQPFFGQPVRRIARGSDGRVHKVETADYLLHAERGVVLAAGSWSHLLVESLGLSMRLQPIRGQILSLQADDVPFRHIVFFGSRYAVPKPDGRLVIGATEDSAGFDDRVTAEGLASLLKVGEDFPAASTKWHWDRAWAGLRPKAPDGWPLLGELSQAPGLFLATGHYRNGIMLSAVTGQIVEKWALGQSGMEDW
ncbi:MAG: glycine oxidase ThiO, partial [Firmicutes bacterium]|nr:glycine oxidase ThiO [Bacillota bacterium]